MLAPPPPGGLAPPPKGNPGSAPENDVNQNHHRVTKRMRADEYPQNGLSKAHSRRVNVWICFFFSKIIEALETKHKCNKWIL